MFVLDSILDINECIYEYGHPHNCDGNAACANEAGGFNCTCNTGYQGDGTACTSMLTKLSLDHNASLDKNIYLLHFGRHTCYHHKFSFYMRKLGYVN